MKINRNMIIQSYNVAKLVYSEDISISDAINELNNQCGMKKSSAQMYINAYICMRCGKKYGRKISEEATEYYLQKIYDEVGHDALQKALVAVDLYLKSYTDLGKSELKGIRSIYNTFMEINNNGVIYNEYNDVDEKCFIEGKAIKVTINRYERDANARKKCLEHYGCKCVICGVQLSDVYGDIAKDFIHIHHLIELSTIKKEYVINPIKDLRPLCPNCHAIVHRKSPALCIDNVKMMLKY